MPTSVDLYHPVGFFLLASVGEEFVHNPLEMPSSTSYKAKTKEPKSVNGTSTTCITILGCRLLKTICIWSLSDDLSTISIIFGARGKWRKKWTHPISISKPQALSLTHLRQCQMKTVTKTPRLSRPMSVVVRTPKMRTNVGPFHSEIMGIKWSSMTHLTHGPSSLYCKVGGELEDNLRSCTSQCRAS